jgi:hypothetical protein
MPCARESHLGDRNCHRKRAETEAPSGSLRKSLARIFQACSSSFPLGADLLAFLPSDSVRHLTFISPVPVKCADSWDELDRLLSASPGECVLLDPGADGTPKLKIVERILNKHRSARFAAYAQVTPTNMKAVFRLSKCGLRRVFIYPTSGTDSPLISFLERERFLQMSRIVYALSEHRFSSLPSSLKQSIYDVFERPYRYAGAKDIAREARLPAKFMYRQFAQARLISPKDLIILAKAAAGYGYLTLSGYSVRSISKKLGFADERTFVRHMAVVGVNTRRRFDSDWGDILIGLIVRVQKPRIAGSSRQRRLGAGLDSQSWTGSTPT